MSCRICLEEDGPFVHPCQCKGECGNVHSECLTKWIEESGNDHCEICRAKYNKQDVASCNIPRCLRKLCSCYMGARTQLYLKFSSMIFFLNLRSKYLLCNRSWVGRTRVV